MAPPNLFIQSWSNVDLPIISPANPWKSNHALPVYASIVSAALLLIHAFTLSAYTKPILVRLNLAKEREISPQPDTGGHVKSHGGRVIFAIEVLTLLGSLELLRVSFTRVLALEGLERDVQSFACITFAYSSLLAFFAVVLPRPTLVSHHINLMLAASWIIFFVQDVVPLMTYTRIPADPLYMLWHLISVLSITAVVLPLVKPRPYVPLDPSDPMPPSPEQTASWLSLLLFAFQDATIWKAYRAPRLPLAELPPLADTDHSKHLVRAAFPHFDPYTEHDDASGRRKRPQRHMFLALAAVFRPQIIVATLLLLSDNAATLLAPYAFKRLLEHLDNRDAATVNPWVWVTSLFLAPLASAIIKQQYQTLLGHSTVRLEALLTQLLLKHALRIRVVAEVDSPTIASTPPAAPSVAPSQSTSSNESSPPPAELESDETVAGEPESKPTTPPPHSKGKSLVGRMNNLISSDLQALSRAAEFLQVFFGAPVMIVLTIGFLYNLLGWSALVGFAVLVVQIPLPIMLSRLLQGAAKEVAKKSDDRVETVTETTSVIRMIKMFGWEKKMSKRINEKREAELTWVWWSQFYTVITMIFHYLLPALTMIATFTLYALVMKRTLNAATVFSSIALFNILRTKVAMLFMWLPNVLKGNVSLQRISDFLYETELLDKLSEDAQRPAVNGDINQIGFRAATFSWAREDANQGAQTPSKRRFRLQIKEELLFKRGSINLIVGPTGSGKTSLLMALLGEMHFLPSGPGAWFNLPRAGGVAYAAQESWVLNATIKENILFGAPFDEERYNKVLDQCALIRDLELFDAGDCTEVGEKGVTLSGGQKARLTLARAVYSSAEIILLDDVIAALDVHTAKWIVDKCLVGDLVQGRTVILVTHNVSIAAPVSEFVVSLGSDGHILSQGTTSDALAKNSKLELQVAEEKVAEEKVEHEIGGAQEPEVPSKGKLIVEEETSQGHLSWESIKMYLIALGGKHWLVFWTSLIIAYVFECIIEVLQPWILGVWATQYTLHPPSEVNATFYLTGYVGLVVLMLAVAFCVMLTLNTGSVRASASIHKRLVDTILGTTLRWLDKTPTSRITTRVTQDIAAGKFDSVFPDLVSNLLAIVTTLIVHFVAILVFAPRVGLFGLAIFVYGAFIGNVYMKAQMSVKREMSKAKAPVLAHFGASIEGLTSIRAYGAEDAVLLDSLAKIDNYSRASYVFNDLARWVAIRVDSLGGLFTALLAAYFVYVPDTGISTSDSAFTLTMAVFIGRLILMFVQVLNMFEVNGNSLERILQYLVIEQEPTPRAEGVPPAHWPSSGALRVENLSASYAPDGPRVLHDLSFTVSPGERIGVVGRTGSGKSSLMLALLRCIPTEGKVWYDGLDTGALNLENLREGVTVIPQVPELLSGTLRRNLDPFDQFDDATLNGALRDAGLFALQPREDGDGYGDESRLTLDSGVARGGGNLSVGQRQIVALARAMVRQSKVLILDEATSAIDYKTDAIIQESLRTQLAKDVTVITVAHRLQSVMDADRIMVLDAGRIAEFGAPRALLQLHDATSTSDAEQTQTQGYFRALVDESADRAALYAAAGLAAPSLSR